jgi:hypothetical protein
VDLPARGGDRPRVVGDGDVPVRVAVRSEVAAEAEAVASARASPDGAEMIMIRRFLVFQLLLLWQGGFLFYTSVVVSTGTDVLGSAAAQGAITARVTEALNLLGVIGLVTLATELGLTRDPASRRTEARWWCWWIAFLCQGLLFTFHRLLDAFMDPQRMHVVIHPPFYPVHRMYLWASTIQWLACLAFAWLTLLAWRAEDRAYPGQ